MAKWSKPNGETVLFCQMATPNGSAEWRIWFVSSMAIPNRRAKWPHRMVLTTWHNWMVPANSYTGWYGANAHTIWSCSNRITKWFWQMVAPNGFTEWPYPLDVLNARTSKYWQTAIRNILRQRALGRLLF